ncbi:MAG: InlB B-repeat-containing protein [Peptococcaceae bacterium]|nr:InlB B-repeat-containing protein [Peptococcaceae bacterium]
MHALLKIIFLKMLTVSLITGLPAAGGASVDLSPRAQRNNDWGFIGWNTDSKATRGLISYPAGNITLYAIYSKTLTAYFQDYSGELIPKESEPMYNKDTTAKLYLPDQPDWVEPLSDGVSGTWKAGGWTQSTLRLADPIPSDYVTIDENETLLPYYGLYQLTVTASFDTRGGTPIPPPETATHYVNSYNMANKLWNKVSPPVLPIKQGYVLKGWLSSYSGKTTTLNPEGWAIDRDTTYTTMWDWDEEAHGYSSMKQYLAIGTGENPSSFNQVDEMLSTLNYTPDPSSRRQLAMTFIWNYLEVSNVEVITTSLHNILQISEEKKLPVIIHLDGLLKWQNRPDLWNWWNRGMPGFSEDNINNVERFDWGENKTTAVTVGWRNWGDWQPVAPAPNLASETLRNEQANILNELIPIIANWHNALPADQKYLLGGVVFGWELSAYTQANYYRNDNEQDYYDWQKPGKTLPVRNKADLMALGYAAAQELDLQTEEGGLITQATLDAVCKDYLRFTAVHAISLGLDPGRIITHSVCSPATENYGGGHSGMASILNDDPIFADVIPGWSCYNSPQDAWPLYDYWPYRFNENEGRPWGAAETGFLDGSGNVRNAQFYNSLFNYKRNCYIDIYGGGWAGIKSYNTVGHKNYNPAKYNSIIGALKETLQQP